MIGTLAMGGVVFPFTDIKAQNADTIAATPISNQDEATTRAKMLHLLPKEAVINSVQERNFLYDTWEISFATPDRDKDGNKMHSGEIVLLAADGSLVSFDDSKRGNNFNGMEFDAREERVSHEQAIPIAEAFIKNQNWMLDATWIINPYPESAFSTRGDDKSLHKIRFSRTQNGIPDDQQYFNVYIDRVTGAIVSYQVQWVKVTFASPNSIISKKDAGNILFNLIQPNLYISNEAGNPQLVYALNPSYTIDAIDGKYPDKYNMPNTKKDDTLLPRISAERAKRLLLSMYELELKYLYVDTMNLGLYYQLVIKPSIPLFYSGSAPMLDANSGIWRDFIGNPLTQPVPGASDWLNEILASPDRITYKAAIALNGKMLPLNDEPIIEGGATLVPFRELFEKMQATLEWDPVSQKVTAKTDSTTIELTINSKTAYVNGKPYLLTVPAQIVNSLTYVPARFAAEALGAGVKWEASSRLVLINTTAFSNKPLTEESLMLLRLEAQRNWEIKHWQ